MLRVQQIPQLKFGDRPLVSDLVVYASPVSMLCCASYKPAETFCRAGGHVSWSCGAVKWRSFIRWLALVAFFDTWLELFASGVETSIGTLSRYIPGSLPGKESSAPTGQ